LDSNRNAAENNGQILADWKGKGSWGIRWGLPSSAHGQWSVPVDRNRFAAGLNVPEIVFPLNRQQLFLKLLSGDAIFAQRPLLEVLQEYDCDYLFQVKANQPDILDAAKTCFAEVDPDKPDYKTPEKTAVSMCARFGATESMPSMSENI